MDYLTLATVAMALETQLMIPLTTKERQPVASKNVCSQNRRTLLTKDISRETRIRAVIKRKAGWQEKGLVELAGKQH